MGVIVSSKVGGEGVLRGGELLLGGKGVVSKF